MEKVTETANPPSSIKVGIGININRMITTIPSANRTSVRRKPAVPNVASDDAPLAVCVDGKFSAIGFYMKLRKRVVNNKRLIRMMRA